MRRQGTEGPFWNPSFKVAASNRWWSPTSIWSTSIRKGLRQHFREGNISTTLSPSSPLARADEPTEERSKAMLGTISTALVLGAAREADMADFMSSPFESKGVCHEWHCQALVRLPVFDSKLRELDSTLLSFAGPRGAEGWLVSRPLFALCLRIVVTPTERVATVPATRV